MSKEAVRSKELNLNGFLFDINFNTGEVFLDQTNLVTEDILTFTTSPLSPKELEKMTISQIGFIRHLQDRLPNEIFASMLDHHLVDFFKTLTGMRKAILITQTFGVPPEILIPVLEKHALSLIEASIDNDSFVSTLSSSYPEVIQQVTNSDNIIRLIEASGYSKVAFISKLSPETIQNVVNSDNIISLMESSGYLKDTLIDKLFSLPQEVIQQVINAKNIMGLVEASGYSKAAFISKLSPETIQNVVNADNIIGLIEASGYKDAFINKLSPQAIQNVVNADNIISLMESFGYLKDILIDKLFSLPQEVIKQVINAKNIMGLVEAFGDGKYLFINKLLPIIQGGSVLIDNANFLALSSSQSEWEFKKLLAFTPAINNSSVSVAILGSLPNEQLIMDLLAKTYVEIESSEEKISFLQEWSHGLKKIIDSNRSLKIILEQAAEKPGNIFIVNSLSTNKDNVNGLFIENDGDIFILKRDCNSSLSTLVHEATHKATAICYGGILPYSPTDKTNPVLLDKIINEESRYEQKLYSKLYIDLWSIKKDQGFEVSEKDLCTLPKNWLQVIISNYTAEKYNVELLTFFTQSIAELILKGSLEYTARPSFMKTVWEFLQILLIIPLGQEKEEGFIGEEMPQFNEQFSAGYPESTDPIAVQAKKLIRENSICLEWLDLENGSGKLAFQSMPFFIKKTFYDKLFALPQEQLKTILNQYIIKVIKAFGDEKYSIIDKLFSLPEGIPQLINADNIVNLIKEFKDDYSIIEKLLPPEVIPQLINADNVVNLIGAFKDNYFVIEKLLPPEVVQRVINADNVVNLIEVSGVIINKLSLEVIQRVINVDNVMKAIEACRGCKPLFLYKLFSSSTEVIQNIITSDNILELIKLTGNGTLSSLFKSHPSVIQPILQKEIVNIYQALNDQERGTFKILLEGSENPSPIIEKINELLAFSHTGASSGEIIEFSGASIIDPSE